MSFLPFSLFAAALAVSLFLLYTLFRRTLSSQRLPPGPKPLPIIGNLHQIPELRKWEIFKQWGERYGHVVSVTIFGKPIVILNSARAVTELMEKRAGTYAGRPRLVMAGELVDYGRTMTLRDYTEEYRTTRKLFHHALGPRGSQDYRPSQLKESRQMIARILRTPDDFEAHIQRAVISVIFLLAYGYQIESNEDYFVKLAKKNVNNFTRSTVPGAYLVDVLPFLRYIPAWFPGARFQREAAQWRADNYEMKDEPFAMVKRNMAAGTARPSFTSVLLEDGSYTGTLQEYEDAVKWAAGTIYGAGADTTASAIMTFYRAMLQYPDVQAKAQAELDEIVGRDRMPTYEDKDSLVYCGALVKEVLRWQVILPLGLPHKVMEEDVYEGYTIPKGSTILANIWATATDPEVYASPERFMPERFLSPDGKSPHVPDGVRDIGSFCFGFGRRVCPGSHVAEASLYIAVVNTLWTFSISPPKGTDGRPVFQELEYTGGMIRRPQPFACEIKPRFAQASEIVRQSVAEYEVVGEKAQ